MLEIMERRVQRMGVPNGDFALLTRAEQRAARAAYFTRGDGPYAVVQKFADDYPDLAAVLAEVGTTGSTLN